MENFTDGGFRLSENEPEMVEPGEIPWDDIPDDLGEPAEKLKQKTDNAQQQHQDAAFPEVFTASQLEREKYTPLNWIVENTLAPGVILLAGAPKSGKTRLATAIAAAVACGDKALGKIETRQVGVLCLFLEDSKRRIQERLFELLPVGTPWPSHLHISTEWPKGDEGLDRLDAFLTHHREVELVIIDVLEKIRPPMPGGRSVYQYDYGTINGIKKVADEHGIAIFVVHHTNKRVDTPDALSRISGTSGLAGAADTIMVLERENSFEDEAILHITGREVEAQDLSLKYEPDTGTWTILGDASLYATSEERRQIIAYIENNGPKTPTEIATALGKNPSTARNLMRNMWRDSQLIRVGKGQYNVLGKG